MRYINPKKLETNLISSNLNSIDNYSKLYNEILAQGSKYAAVCYSEKDYQEINNESQKKTLSRLNVILENGHHSVFDHINMTFEIKNIPKIFAMLLNNQRLYTTSEKSARYTTMKLSKQDEKLYEKWQNIFEKEIEKKYPFLDSKTRRKKSLENSRYLTSIFTPTKMIHSISYRQLNNLMHHFDQFIPENDLESKLIPYMQQFNKNLKEFYNSNIDPRIKKRELIFSSGEKYPETFGFLYSMNTNMSFAAFAQAQRHRTIEYTINKIEKNRYYIPEILKDNDKLREQWLNDSKKKSEKDIIQGQIINIREKGILNDFLSKAYERNCNQAQLEIQKKTVEQTEKYIQSVAKKIKINRYLLEEFYTNRNELKSKNLSIDPEQLTQENKEFSKIFKQLRNAKKLRCQNGYNCKEKCNMPANRQI